MKWLRAIGKRGFSKSLNLPNQLTRELQLSVGAVIQLEWSPGSAVILLRPLSADHPLSDIRQEEAGMTAHLPPMPPKPVDDSSVPLP